MFYEKDYFYLDSKCDLMSCGYFGDILCKRYIFLETVSGNHHGIFNTYIYIYTYMYICIYIYTRTHT